MTDPTRPDHYRNHPAFKGEWVDTARHMNFCSGNAGKYLWRAGRKGDTAEDLNKALYYLDASTTVGDIPTGQLYALTFDAAEYLDGKEYEDVTTDTVRAIRRLVVGDFTAARNYTEAALQRVSEGRH